MPQPSPTNAPPVELDLRDPHVRADAYPTYAALRAHGPLAPGILRVSDQDDKDPSGTLGREIFIATGYDEAVAAMVDERFTIDPGVVLTPEQVGELPALPEELWPLTRTLLSIDPPVHTRLRRLVQPSFTPRAIETWRPRIAAIADELLDAAERTAA